MYNYNLKCELIDSRNKSVVTRFKAREMAVDEVNASFVGNIASGGQRYGIETFEQISTIKILPYNYNIVVSGKTYKIIVVTEKIIGLNGKKATNFILE